MVKASVSGLPAGTARPHGRVSEERWYYAVLGIMCIAGEYHVVPFCIH